MALKYLGDVAGVTHPDEVVQYNFEALEEAVWYPETPSKVSGVATTIIGPPTAGTYALKERWVDAKGGLWVCTAAGTPGTWAQLRPAIVAADPGWTPALSGYLILRSDLKGLVRYYTGSGWADVIGTRDVTLQDAINVVLGTATGSKIGTATNQKLGFYGVAPVVQPAAIADPTGGGTVDTQARASIAAIIDLLQALGLDGV